MQSSCFDGKREVARKLWRCGGKSVAVHVRRHERARIRPKNDAHRGTAMFDVSSTVTTLTGNQKRLSAPRCIGDALEILPTYS